MSKNPENPGNPKVPLGLERFTAIEPFTKLTAKEQAKEYAKIITDLMKNMVSQRTLNRNSERNLVYRG